ncbi:glycosyltransferase family 2 protein [Elizabethkingia anophelis]|uniref:glycosyltransferase family 2 protein n=2 Tax=Elizabethkingia anophelis TaxID=1117645 RepID=UPI0020119D4C|nr:glycosyltransferase family 2 protein [Elizabethkingia anophelis]MCL1640119.1 glycosyltransferase family 2 protein [Elizabethkingia anophelis]MCL1645463.1 glycosyltransferase family 2 protein [Elizabethkingia anophelis]WJJ99015.1 glycosyltransferase family 2 protein [Elizabethkingia anophelis]
MKISLILSTYNWPEALDLCLKSIMLQTIFPDEILIADDGSTSSTLEIIQKYQNSSTIPIHHIWHEDNGFELAKIRNKAIARASGDYIIQIDGDLILHSFFVQDHIKFAKKNSFVRASRIYMNESLSLKKLTNQIAHANPFEKGISNFFSSVRIPFLWKYFETNYKMQGDERWEIHGCNMAYWKEDAIAINGYNEDFKGWGPEDKEFVARLLNSGKEKRFLKLGGIIFHIHHAINKKENLKRNEEIFEYAKKNNVIYCKNGINQYL